MKDININVTETGCQRSPLLIGYQGENEVTRVIVDYSAWTKEFGEGTLSLEIMRAGDTVPYLTTLTEEDGKAVWTVSNVDTGAHGEGAAGFVFTIGEQVKKSAVFRFFVGRDVGGTPGDRPDPYESLITYMEKLLAQTEENAAAAETAQGAAETAQTAAEAARDAAASSATGAAGSATTATQQAQAAATARAAAETAQTAAETAQGTAEAARDAAASSATDAAGSATTATQQAQAAATARAAAETAQTAAEAARDAAASSATDAAGSATTATQQAQAAAAARADAEGAQRAAETAQGAAEAAKTAAETAQTAAVAAKTATETARDTAVSTLQTEGAAQRTAIQQKGEEVLESIPEDYTDLSDEVGDLKSAVKKKAPVIIDTASGAIANFEDGAADMPLKSLTVNIEPVQSGTGDPSPDNVRPITGWTGCNIYQSGLNLFNIAKVTNGNGYTKTEDYITSTVGYSSSGRGILYTGSIAKKAGQSLTLTADIMALTNAGRDLHLAYYSGKTTGSYTGHRRLTIQNYNTWETVSFTFTAPAGSLCIAIQPQINGNTLHIRNIRLSYGSTDQGFSEYVGTSLHITFPPEASTVYGGTLDVANAKLKACPYYENYDGETLVGPWVSSMDVYAPGTNPTIGAQVVDLGGVVAEYDLSDIPEITTLLGTNNIWADCGDVKVEYPADTKLYIQKINAPTDDDMTADTQIDSGKYFLIGNTLYLSTTVIPAGDIIIPGTNCTKTNLAAALNALNA